MESIDASTLTRLLETDDYTISDVKHGFRNQLIFLCAGGVPCVVKGFKDAESFLGEKKGLSIIARSGIDAPKLVRTDDDERIIVMSRVEGRPLAESDIDTETLGGVAKLLRKLHATDVRGETFDADHYPAMLSLFRENILGADSITEDEKRICRKAFERIEPFFRMPDTEETFVHADVTPTNLLKDLAKGPQSLSLVDFEKSHKGFSEADLAKACWRIAKMDGQNMETLISSYDEGDTKDRKKILDNFLIYEFLGAVSYYCWEGNRNGYPYKDEAVIHLAKIVYGI